MGNPGLNHVITYVHALLLPFIKLTVSPQNVALMTFRGLCESETYYSVSDRHPWVRQNGFELRSDGHCQQLS